MTRIVLLILVVFGIPSKSIAFDGKERLIWEKLPLEIGLKVGEERVIHFPSDIEHWLPTSISNHVIAQVVADTFYIKAIAEFPPVRFRIRERATNRVYLLDINAREDAEVPNVIVVVDENMIRGESEREAKITPSRSEDWRVRLTRYASQTLYSPARILEADSGIRRVPLKPDVGVPLVRGGKVESKTIASWSAGGWYLHAVKLTNNSSDELILDPRISYRGNWDAVTAQHSKRGAQASLGSRESDESITTVYLISRRTFFESLGVAE